MAYNLFELDALSVPDDNWGYRARAASENRVYETFSAPDVDDDGAESDDSDWIPRCASVRRILNEAPTAGAMFDALKAHRAECAACGSTRKTVATDRELVDACAVCCESEAA